MAHLRLDDKKIELSVGDLWIGADGDAGVRFGAAPERGTLAIITVDSRGTATVRRATSGDTVLVNGVALGAEPAPLLHGDRIEVAGRQLRFSDDRKAGSTVVVPALDARADTGAPAVRGRAGISGGHVNAARAGNAHPLRRGDIIRVGAEEFRFYADQPAAAPSQVPSGVRRPVVASRPSETRGPAAPSRGSLPMVLLAGAVLIGATVLLLIQDR